MSMAGGAGALMGGNSLDRSNTLSWASPSGPLRRLASENERYLKLPEESKEFATGMKDLFIPVTGGTNCPMGIGGAMLSLETK